VTHAALVLPLPVDAHLDEVRQRLAERGSVVVVAPPGSGKSTRIPPDLISDSGQVLLLQPRRVAARSLARRIASERGWQLGGEVGYQVRFEKVGSPATRLWVMTEGTLTRRLLDDPYLDGVSTVILDEFHERSLHSDLCLAWCAELRRTVREDLRLIVMSATLDAEPIAAFLGDVPIVRVATPTYPVQTRLIGGGDDRRIGEQVAVAVADAIVDPECGDVLVFLPGTGEIRAAQAALEGLAQKHSLAVLPLHGSLPPEDQDRALVEDAQGRRKVVLSTNVAETSVTIPGVRTVIDSGLARVARFDADSGFDRLVLERIPRSSADQRAGRAGRTAPGRCWRLWSNLEDHRLAAHADPEIARVDLAPTLLALKAWHGDDPRTFPWFVVPEAPRFLAGETLLHRLGALREPFGPRTPLGDVLAKLPVHPRLGRLLSAAREAGVPRLGATLAALVSERDIRPPPRRDDRPPDPAPSDAIDRIERLTRAEHQRFRHSLRDEGIDPIAAREIARVRDDLLSLVGDRRANDDPNQAEPREIARLLLAAFPDRVARRTAAMSDTCAMVGGITLEIDRVSTCAGLPGRKRHELMCCYAIQSIGDRVRQRIIARQAAEIDESDLEAVLPGGLERRELVSYDAARGAVSGIVGWYWGDLCLRANPGAQLDPERVSACLAEALTPQARAFLAEDEACASLLLRVAWLRQQMPELELPDLDDAACAEIVRELCHGCRSRQEAAAKGRMVWLQAAIGHERARRVDQLAPERITVPTGSAIRLTYEDPQRPPVLAVRIQELFGLPATPTIRDGRVSVLLHLLGPNYRPEQVTQDLTSFWVNTYPQVRKDLRSRYPKHSWPDDPLTAPPVRKGRSERA
jgi:ATP-dependent helicase HrpB